MIDINIVLILLLIHWFADFVMQSEKMALGKSKHNENLLQHTLTYSSIWLAPMFLLGEWNSEFTITKIFAFIGITFISHTITDYLTSRIVSKKFANNQLGSNIPNLGAFSVIGFDQLLHYIQIFLTYKFLFL